MRFLQSHNQWMRVTRENSEGEFPVELPDRYLIRRRGEVQELICSESPTITVRIERGTTVPAGAVRKASPGSIYLDGAAEGGPFLDVEKAVFNLDHHEGCVRSFTLATCEQAMVVVRKGLDLQKRDWTIYANDPDLDTVLAVWVLLNHVRLNEVDPEIRSRVMPLVRLQGVIDAHGLEMQELCGLPPELQEALFAALERLRSKEVALKKGGKWQEIDFLQYTADLLRTIDAIVYSSRHFEGVVDIEELSRADLGEDRLAIVCRGEGGIYEVEAYLRRLHGKRLAAIILQQDPGTYTVRQVDAFLPATLDSAYEWLNLIDPAAGSRHSGNRWGGSGEIGGSPRATGTALTPQQIADTLARAYRRPTALQRLAAVGLGLLGSCGVIIVAMVLTYFVGWHRDPLGSIESYFKNHAGSYASALILFTAVLGLAVLRRRPKLFGLCVPAGFDWLFLFPGAVLGGLGGGAWIFAAPIISSQVSLKHRWSELAIAIGFPIAAEVLFRGLVHGTLAQRFPIQHPEGRWFLSWPVIISSLLYASWSLVPFLPFSSPVVSLTFAAALLFGISSGMARERSESLLPCLILHWSCLAIVAIASS
ncbi:MAG: hypothetical protein A3F90_03595 [Deltaproteobacteria bacterium RIFCSPLOWO2_12_FULL_60_19]|nr:MAG: hypothetical protein A3F90_03595 [Deltaproteobacteria bacterium RIFCSPLOWO2_12_FULL_60_19]